MLLAEAQSLASPDLRIPEPPQLPPTLVFWLIVCRLSLIILLLSYDMLLIVTLLLLPPPVLLPQVEAALIPSLQVVIVMPLFARPDMNDSDTWSWILITVCLQNFQIEVQWLQFKLVLKTLIIRSVVSGHTYSHSYCSITKLSPLLLVFTDFRLF